MIKQYTTILLDMYGVILNEPTGRLLDYLRDTLDQAEYSRIEATINEQSLFSKANRGEINACELFEMIGLQNCAEHTANYIENYFTLDAGFTRFAEAVKGRYDLVLLSNDLVEWSDYICKKHDLDKYFKDKIISASVKCVKPQLKMFDLALERINRSPYECIFVDNKAENLLAAEEVGIAPFLFDRGGEHYYGASVSSFDELLSYIG